jgi:hypothetical protein
VLKNIVKVVIDPVIEKVACCVFLSNENVNVEPNDKLLNLVCNNDNKAFIL